MEELAELNDKYLDLKAENESLKKEIFKLQIALMLERQKNRQLESDKKLIVCPKCKHICKATLIETTPFYKYIHSCIACNYVITEIDGTFL